MLNRITGLDQNTIVGVAGASLAALLMCEETGTEPMRSSLRLAWQHAEGWDEETCVQFEFMMVSCGWITATGELLLLTDSGRKLAKEIDDDQAGVVQQDR